MSEPIVHAEGFWLFLPGLEGWMAPSNFVTAVHNEIWISTSQLPPPGRNAKQLTFCPGHELGNGTGIR